MADPPELHDRRHFGTRWTANSKDLPHQGFVPPLARVLQDKIETLPERSGPDRTFKQLKDVIDIHSLLYHNREGLEGRDPAEMAQELDPRSLERAVEVVEEVAGRREDHREEIDGVLEALRGGG